LRKIVRANDIIKDKKIRIFDHGYIAVAETKKKSNIIPIGDEPVVEKKVADVEKFSSISESMEVIAAKKIAEKTILSAQNKSQEIINIATKEAGEKAKNILKDAQIKADMLAQRAFDDEEKQGYENGFKQSRKEIFDLRKNILDSIDSIESHQKSLNNDINDKILDISLAVASKIIHREIENDNDIVYGMIEKALSEIKGKSNVNVVISKKIIESIDDIKAKLNEKDIFNRYIDFTVQDIDGKDDEILVDCADITLDMSIDTQLENIKNFFTMGD